MYLDPTSSKTECLKIWWRLLWNRFMAALPSIQAITVGCWNPHHTPKALSSECFWNLLKWWEAMWKRATVMATQRNWERVSPQSPAAALATRALGSPCLCWVRAWAVTQPSPPSTPAAAVSAAELLKAATGKHSTAQRPCPFGRSRSSPVLGAAEAPRAALPGPLSPSRAGPALPPRPAPGQRSAPSVHLPQFLTECCCPWAQHHLAAVPFGALEIHLRVFGPVRVAQHGC